MHPSVSLMQCKTVNHLQHRCIDELDSVFEPVLTKKRGRGHLGLGATPKDTDNELPHKKKREADDDEKKKKKKEMGEGSFVIITGGRNEGLKGRIKSMETTHVNIVLETSSEVCRLM